VQHKRRGHAGQHCRGLRPRKRLKISPAHDVIRFDVSLGASANDQEHHRHSSKFIRAAAGARLVADRSVNLARRF